MSALFGSSLDAGTLTRAVGVMIAATLLSMSVAVWLLKRWLAQMLSKIEAMPSAEQFKRWDLDIRRIPSQDRLEEWGRSMGRIPTEELSGRILRGLDRSEAHETSIHAHTLLIKGVTEDVSRVEGAMLSGHDRLVQRVETEHKRISSLDRRVVLLEERLPMRRGSDHRFGSADPEEGGR